MKNYSRKSYKRKVNILKLSISVFILVIICVGIFFAGRGVALLVSKSKERGKLDQKQENTYKNNSDIITEADIAAKMYDYDKALDILNLANKKDDQINNKIQEIQAQKDSLVKYEGEVEHIFYHSLIVYPELAFDNDKQSEGYNMYMATVSEFKKQLPLLQEKGYVLYPLSECIKVNEDGTVTKKDIYLPPGKKPLVISIDDVSYYKYMDKDGFADKLVLDENGNIATEVKTPEGKVEVTRDGDIFPILDDYVKENPEFSYKGTKGTLALTGYEGSFGYYFVYEGGKTKKDDGTFYTEEEAIDLNQKESAQAKKVADRLKETGWSFACHSFTHNSYFRDGSVTMERLTYDTEKWLKYMTPVIGQTNMYISPFGVGFNKNDERYLYIVSKGFNIYCPVGSDRRTYQRETSIYQPRVNIDGITMFKRKDFITEHYFDVDKVIDPSRPELK